MKEVKEIAKLITNKSSKEGIYLWLVYDQVIEEIQKEVEILEEEMYSEEIIKEKIAEHEEYSMVYIEKGNIENLWFAENPTDLIPDEDQYVCLKPLMYYECLGVKLDDLLPIEKRDFLKLITLIRWKKGAEYELKEGYEEFANSLIK